MIQPQQDYALRVLVAAGAIPDKSLDIGETALALAALDEGPASINAYRDFLDRVVRDIAQRTRPGMPLDDRIGVLTSVMVEHYGFVGDQDTYNDLANANLMRVIDRRRGLPVTLGVLYLHIGRKLGWNMVGLNFPGHFLLRIEAGGAACSRPSSAICSTQLPRSKPSCSLACPTASSTRPRSSCKSSRAACSKPALLGTRYRA